jgi:signal transduction histidine kinase
MVGTVAALLFGLAVAAGLGLCALAGYAFATWDEPGVLQFSVFAGMLGVAGIAGGGLGVTTAAQPDMDTPALWGLVAFLVLVIATVPWVLFALQYTGRFTRVRRRTVVALSFPPVVAVPVVWLSSTVQSDNVGFQILGTIISFYVLFLLMVGIYLLVRTTYEYGHLSLGQGVSLALAGFVPFFTVNLAGPLAADIGTPAIGLFTGGFLVPLGALALALFRYDTFEATPAAGTVGERAIARETDDLLFVLDEDGRLIRRNDTARERLGTEGDPLGEPVETVLGATPGQLRGRETVELTTGVGRRRFDVQVSQFTDQHGRPLGFVVSLRDVTERELREQRLEVLNRVLRHNLRNRVEVIKSNAEELAAQTNSGHAETIADSADGLAELGAKARAIDRFVSRSVRETERDLVAEIESLVAETGGDVTLTAPETAPLVTDWGALTAALESAIENAVEYADDDVRVTVESGTDGYTVVVADDGPGIPDSELAAIDAGTETALQHGTGLGLWRLTWGVTKLNGDLSFDTDDGTTVRMTIPDRRA